MPVTCTPSSLAAKVGCLDCLPDNQVDGIITYLLTLYSEQHVVSNEFLLQESGDYILLEDGGKIGLQ